MIASKCTTRTEQILALLQESTEWRSGEEISTHLGISRAAVAKHVSHLRDQGNAIESAPRRGYRLLFIQEPLDIHAVKQYLKTTRLGQREWHLLTKASSTSNEAISLALNNAREGTIVVAEQQINGRGRKRKHWFSAPRSLQFSLILRPELSNAALSKVTAAGTLAIADAVQEITGLDVTVKRPNDLLLGSKKIAGFLEEMGTRGGVTDWLVLGIGCNVNTLPSEFPAELQPIATSIYEHNGKPVSRNALFTAMLNWLEHWYDKLSLDEKAVQIEWEKRQRENNIG